MESSCRSKRLQSFRDRLIDEVYPELGEYLKDDPIEALAHNLKTSASGSELAFDTDGTLGAAKRIVAGKGQGERERLRRSLRRSDLGIAEDIESESQAEETDRGSGSWRSAFPRSLLRAGLYADGKDSRSVGFSQAETRHFRDSQRRGEARFVGVVSSGLPMRRFRSR